MPRLTDGAIFIHPSPFCRVWLEIFDNVISNLVIWAGNNNGEQQIIHSHNTSSQCPLSFRIKLDVLIHRFEFGAIPKQDST